MANGILKVGEITTSSGSGSITIPSEIILKNNIPAFAAYMADSSQSISTDTNTKINMTTEDYDTDGAYDATNAKFTIPTGAAGKYRFIIGVRAGNTHTSRMVIKIYKNNSAFVQGENRWAIGSGTTFVSVNYAVDIDCAAGDYFEPYVYMSYNAGLKGSSTERQTFWSASKIGA